METDFLITGTGLDLWWFFILTGVSFLASFISSVLGLGGGMLLIAVMALALPPVVLIPIHGAIQLGSNFGRAGLLHRHVLRSIIPAFLIGSIIGVAVGTHFLITLPLQFLQFVLVVFVLYATWAPKFQASNPNSKTFFIVGAIGSFITMFVGATGPVIAPLVSAACKDRQQIVATHAALMVFQHGLKIISFGLLGFAFGPYMPLMVFMIGFGFMGTYCGKFILNKLPEKIFRLSFKIVLTILALKLFYNAI